MPLTVHTIGYEGRTIDEFVGLLVDLGAQLVADTRENPSSRKEGFTAHELAAHLAERSIEYVHFEQLGCPKRARDALRSGARRDEFYEAYRRHLATVGGAVDRLEALAREQRTVILCMERDPRDCHRWVLAQRLADDGFDVRHVPA